MKKYQHYIDARGDVLPKVKPDIIACTETWLKPEISSLEKFPDSLGYTIILDDSFTGQGSCVLLTISKRLTCEEQPDPKFDQCYLGKGNY